MGEETYDNYFVPTAFHTAPALIRVPANCPVGILVEVRSAFSLFWCDFASCLNRIRNAIELLLNEMGVKRYGIKGDGKRARMSLDNRIGFLRSKEAKLGDLCDRLLAVKHLGNAGSHPGNVKKEDVFDGFDILEHVLLEKYENPHSQLSHMVKQINKRKGPRKKQS